MSTASREPALFEALAATEMALLRGVPSADALLHPADVLVRTAASSGTSSTLADFFISFSAANVR